MPPIEEKSRPSENSDIKELVSFDLSYTLVDPLHKGGVKTIEDLLKRSKKSLEEIPDIGEIRYAQIEEVLKSLGFPLPA